MPLYGIQLREAIANAPTIHELADGLEGVLVSNPDQGAIEIALELIRRARAVPKQPLRY